MADAGSPVDAGTPVDAGAPFDATTPSDAQVADATSASATDASGSIDASADVVQPVPDAGTVASSEAGTGVPMGPTFANWPMPNPVSSGLPNPSSYDTSVSGVVLDEVTGLMWQQTEIASGNVTTLQQAAAYCSALNLGNFTDWRLPSRIEVWSIQDFMTSSPALDPVFGALPTGPQGNVAPWTSTQGLGDFTYGGVQFGDNGVLSVDSTLGEDATGGGSIRCVRGSTDPPSPHYTVQNGTVFDHGTKLTWQEGYDPTTSLPNGVANYCASLTLAGGGWRAPSIKELESIVDNTRVGPSIDPVFQMPAETVNDTDNQAFYSGTAYAPPPPGEYWWYLNFVAGFTGTGQNTGPFEPTPGVGPLEVRCVK